MCNIPNINKNNKIKIDPKQNNIKFQQKIMYATINIKNYSILNLALKQEKDRSVDQKTSLEIKI